MPKKCEKTYTVIRDTREQAGNGWFFEPDELNGCLGTEIATLKTGDYSLKGYEDIFVVERKRNCGEIANNITEKRFLKELERLAEFQHSFIVCEFSLADVFSFPLNSGIPKSRHKFLRVNSKFILSHLLEYEVKYGVSILFAGNAFLARQMMRSLFKRIVANA